MSGTIQGPRGATPEDLPGVIALVDGAMRQGSDQTMRTDYPLVYAPGNLDNVSVVTVDGRPVATAPFLQKRVEGDGFGFGMGVISPTATDPAHQHHGYGSACVARCIERMDAAGLQLSVLWTAVPTFPFYERNGYQAVARYGSAYRLGARDAARFSPLPASTTRTTLADTPDRLADVLRLHEAETPGVVRTPEDAAALYRLPKMTTWLAMDGDRVAADLLDSRAQNKPGLLEAAGDPTAIEGLIHDVLAGLGPDETIDLHTEFAPDGLTSVAEARLADAANAGDVRRLPYDGNMMLRLNDPAGFLRSIRGWMAQRRPPAVVSVSIEVIDAGVTISLEWRAFGLAIGTKTFPTHVELKRQELTSMIFGSHPERPVDVPDALRWFPQFRVPIPVLDRS